jgi:DNA-binding response OmpR family regulator
MHKILVIDDDQESLTLISEVLQAYFQPIVASSGRQGIALAVSDSPELIILDVHMPEMDGFEVCRRLRSQPLTRHIPIIMLTGEVALDSRVQALDFGADDYVCKPFQFKELIARINARLRRNQFYQKLEAEIQVGNLWMDPKSCQVRINERAVKLTQLEFELLRYFLERPNQVVDRSRILGDLWPDAVVADRTVDTHIANLRRKIKDFNHSLETIYGAGYVLRAPREAGQTDEVPSAESVSS